MERYLLATLTAALVLATLAAPSAAAIDPLIKRCDYAVNSWNATADCQFTLGIRVNQTARWCPGDYFAHPRCDGPTIAEGTYP